jgi:hypothetical protein
LTAEVENAFRVLNTPAARLIAGGEERPLLLEGVEALLASGAIVVDACRNVVRDPRTVVSLVTRPVLFGLVRAGRGVARRCSERSASCSCIRSEIRRRIASHEVANRNRTASQDASATGRCQCDKAWIYTRSPPHAVRRRGEGSNHENRHSRFGCAPCAGAHIQPYRGKRRAGFRKSHGSTLAGSFDVLKVHNFLQFIA